ncbi:MAG: L,D-transpeptidase family protein [Methylophilaceae bacterium]|nr:L,D-transpeptidase family protein [Methylophilaceae bacterium]
MPRTHTRKTRLGVAIVGLLMALPWNATALYMADRPSRMEALLHGAPRQIEGLLVKGLLEITQGRVDAALENIDQVIRLVPNFKLAYLVRGDLLQAKARQISSFGSVPGASHDEIADLREEARVRLERYLTRESELTQPDYLWQLEPGQRHAIVVDTARSRLYLYRNDQGKPRYVADYYVTVGKNGTVKQIEGDKKTPLGVYFAGRQLAKKKLPDFYGSAAYPLNYPNEWDRRLGKNGHGIWLHGTPSDTYSRPPRASDGCLVLTNPDITALAPVLQEGNTPIVIVDRVTPPSPELHTQRANLVRALEAWRMHWERQDTDRYLASYSRDFLSGDGKDFTQWAEEKRRIQKIKVHSKITLSNVSIFRYPDAQRLMAVVSFDQDFKSDRLNNRMRKRQYWVLEDGHWKILYEGAA